MLNLLILMFVILFISMILMILNLVISKKSFIMRMKNSSFECGFEMFQFSRLPFSIQFYLISVLFLVFDVEMIFLFPMILLKDLMIYLSWIMCSVMILLILLIGLEFEKFEGLLKWFI